MQEECFRNKMACFETMGRKCCGYSYWMSKGSEVSMYQNIPGLWAMRFYVHAFDANEMFQVEKKEGTGLSVITEQCH